MRSEGFRRARLDAFVLEDTETSVRAHTRLPLHSFVPSESMSDPQILVRGVPFVIDEEIGYGLHSTVYGGRNLRDGRPVAIKVITFTSDCRLFQLEVESRRQSFWKELDMLLYLQPLNPYVIRVLNYDFNDHYGVIVMERGDTLRDTLVDFILTKRPIPEDLLHRFWSQMVEAVYFMHRIGIVHGDCKPENFIQLGPDGTALRLIDMGISFQLPPNITCRLKTVAGTPGRNAPGDRLDQIAFSFFD